LEKARVVSKKRQLQPTVGIAINEETIEGVIFSPRDHRILNAVTYPLPPGLLTEGGDQVTDPSILAQCINGVLKSLGAKTRQVQLSIPATLLRMVDMPRLEQDELALSLSSEAERYKSFDQAEAVVAFHLLPMSAPASPGVQTPLRLVFGAIRKDTYEAYAKAFSLAKIKPMSIDLEPLAILRSLSGSGVLDSLVGQIGTDQPWGTLFVEPGRLRLSLWQSNDLLELREVYMDTSSFHDPTQLRVTLEDLHEEIRRTSKHYQAVIWLTHGLPTSLVDSLAEEIQVPVRSCFLSPELPAPPDTGLVAAGASFQPFVSFPFSIDFADVVRPAVRGGSSARMELSAANINASGGGGRTVLAGFPSWTMPAWVASFVLLLLIFGGCWFGESMINGEVSTLESQKSAVTNEIAMLDTQLTKLKAQLQLHINLADIAKNARLRNIVYNKLSDDLRYKTPEKLWLSKISVGDDLTFEGKALTHEAALDFARGFDDSDYVSTVMLNALSENVIGTTPLYDFQVGGKIKLNPALLAATTPEAVASAAQTSAAESALPSVGGPAVASSQTSR
jgi:Tfp pilus assembly PilM family ATPase